MPDPIHRLTLRFHTRGTTADGAPDREARGFRLHPGLEFRFFPGLCRDGGRWSGALVPVFRHWTEGPSVVHLHEAWIERPSGEFSVRLGRFSERWGTNALGDLLLGETAPPRWSVRGRYGYSHQIPQHRRLAAELFLSYLDDATRTIPNPLLTGHQLSLRLMRPIRVYAQRTILFGGDGRTGRLNPGDLANILLARHENVRGPRSIADSDQRAALGVEGHARFVRSVAGVTEVRASFEYAGEDQMRILPSAVARQWQLALSGRDSSRVVLAGFETHTGANRWYSHTVYREAYFYRGMPLGLSFGGDARALLLGYHRRPALGADEIRVQLLGEEYGLHSGRHERRLRAEVMIRLPEAKDGSRFEIGGTVSRRVDTKREPTAPPPILEEVWLRWTRSLILRPRLP